MPRVVHFEIPAENPERAAAFFRDAFGWRVEKWDGPMDYWMVYTGEESGDDPAEAEGGIDGGIARRGEMNPRVANTIDVPDIDAYILKVVENGGEIIAPKSAVPGVGWLAYFRDPEGNVHGMMESDPGAT